MKLAAHRSQLVIYHFYFLTSCPELGGKVLYYSSSKEYRIRQAGVLMSGVSGSRNQEFDAVAS
jgi:hypothetical protein